MDLPFGGAISAYFASEAPVEIRDRLQHAGPDDILEPSYPYQERLERSVYEDHLHALQIELAKLQASARTDGTRVACVFEGRDTAGKGGVITRFSQFLNPRRARIAALPAPTKAEQGEWYFQRYIKHLPSSGEMVFFDRSWYNRAVVEKVFGFCSDDAREHFFTQVTPFEQMLKDDGIHLFKFWLNVSRAEQLRRMLAREQDPLKQWKLSKIDVEGLSKWEAYTAAIGETFARSHSAASPWTVIRSDDKRRARIAALQTVLQAIEYENKDSSVIGKTDPLICGGPDIWHG